MSKSKKVKKIDEFIEDIYGSGEVRMEDIKKIKSKFELKCGFCKSSNISIMTENDNDGYCETCSSPYARFTIKCRKCGQAIAIRS